LFVDSVARCLRRAPLTNPVTDAPVPAISALIDLAGTTYDDVADGR